MKNVRKNWILIICSTFIIIWFFFVLWGSRYKTPKDPYIISSIAQARTIMSYIKINEGNYDNFTCQQKEMIALCEQIDRCYGRENSKEPVIAHDAPVDSQQTCIYSPLNQKDSYWYCADSEGYAGYTDIDPGNDGYCVDGVSAKCPPVEG